MATNRHPLSVAASIKLLTSAMQDPMKGDVCSTRMGIAAHRIDQALEACDSVSTKTKLATSYPELLRAGIKFLTFKLSPQEFVAMGNRLVQCRCDFGQAGMRRLHTTPSSFRTDGRLSCKGPSFIYDAVATVANCIILALSGLTQHRYRTGNAKNGEQRWPHAPEDLLPFGPKDSVAGLEHWVAGPPKGYIIFKLAGCLALFHVPFAREVFQYPNFSFALVRPCRHLEAAIKFYQEGDSSPPARMRFFNYPIMTIFQFFDDLSHVDTPQFNMMITANEWLKPILTPLATILSTLPTEWSEIRMHLNYLSSYANAELDRKTGVAMVKFDRSQFSEIIGQRDPLEMDFNKMVDARKMGCWNIQCLSQSDALPSRLCSGCNLIRFCGEKCQKDAWKSAPLPHKAVCAKVYALKEALGSADWSLLWTPDFTYAQFQAMCKAKSIGPEAVRPIASTIFALRLHKRSFLEDLKKAGASHKDRLIRAEQERLAFQKSKTVIDSLGDQVTVMNREQAFFGLNPDAYKLSGA